MKFNKTILLLLVLSLLMISSAVATLDDAVLYYSFDDDDNTGSNPNDLSVSGDDGVTTGADIGVVGSINEAFGFVAGDTNNKVLTTQTGLSNGDTFTYVGRIYTGDVSLATQRVFFSTGTGSGFTFGRYNSNTFTVGTYISGSAYALKRSSTLADNTWYDIVIEITGAGVTTFWLDDVEQTTVVATGSVSQSYMSGTFYHGVRYDSALWYDGRIDEVGIYDRVLTSQERADYSAMTENPYVVDPASIDTLTVNFQNALNLTNISDVIVNYDGTNYTNSTGNQVKINITTAGGNISLLQNFTVYAVDHLSQDVLNWNLSDIYVANLTQSDINYSISEIYTGNAINTFNLTLSNSTKYQTTNGTINLGLNTGSQTFLIEPLNYDAQNVSYTITAKEVSNVTFNDFANGTLELHLVQQQDTNISISAFTASFTPNGTEQVYPTSNGSVFIPVLFGDTYEFDFTSSGYFTGYEDITINQSYQNETYNLSLQGGVLFTFRDSVTQNIITGELNLIVENATFSQTYTFTGGTQIVTNLTDAQEFDFYFYGAGYQTNSYFLTYQNQSEIDLYLINGSDNITYTVLTQGSEVLPDTEITIDKFLSGSWVQIASQLTDVTGRAVFGLERGITHRITFNKDGYTSRVDINRFSDTEFTVVLAESAEINFDLGFQDVRLVVSPSNSTLLPKLTNFSASITSAQALFEYVLLKVYYNGTLLGQDNSTSNVGANLNVNLDLTSYNDTLIMLEYTYKVINVSEITYGTKVYKVVDTVFYEGTLLELKDRLDEKLSIGEKIALYAIVFILTLIFVSIFATGLPAVVASLLIATLAGWVFGINIVLLLFVTATVALFSIAYAGDMI